MKADSQKAVIGRRYKKHYSKYAKERQGTRGDIVEPVPQCELARARDKAKGQLHRGYTMLPLRHQHLKI